jgi:broad specificity phosphatase PhoE
MEITFLRHGESTGNASGLIQGRGSSPLSERGRKQAEAVGRRLRDTKPFDLVISSDMERALETVSAVGVPFEADPVWREMDLGAWDGVPIAELANRFPEELAALRRGDPVPIGGTGESIPDFTERIRSAIDRLVERTDGTGRVLVSSHGGVIERAVALALGTPDSVAFAGRVTNTSLTTISIRDDTMRVGRYNDALHLGPVSGWAAERLAAGDAVVALVRHGRTRANDLGVWQGHTDGGLDEVGRRQAEQLAEWYGGFETLYASPLGRALETAASLRLRESPTVVTDLKELGMGAWEGRTWAEIKEGWPELWEAIYERGEDVPRGGDGETWSGMVSRVSGAVGEIAAEHPGRLIGVVSHGAAIRGFCSSLMGLDHDGRRGLAPPDNASVSHVVFGRSGPVVADYNIGPLA